MNVLSTLFLLAADKAADKAASTPIFGDEGYIGTWQLILLLVLIGLVVFYMIYKKKQREG